MTEPHRTAPHALLTILLALAPAVGVLLLILGYAVFNGADVQSPWRLRSLAVLASGGFILVAQAILATAGPRLRLHAAAPLALTMVMALLLLLAAEAILPRTDPAYNDQQRLLQLRLERRGTSLSEVHRGVTVRAAYNALGWNDDAWPEDDKPRIVLIGDSFLELMSQRTMGALLEERLGGEVEVVNLGQAALSPPDYRDIFLRAAQWLQPDLAVFFIYEGNDFSADYQFEPSVHPAFTVSQRAVQSLRPGDNVPPGLQESFAALEGQTFSSRERFMEALGPGRLDQQQLLYELALAYSPTWEPTRPAPTRLQSIRLIQDLLRGLLQGLRQDRDPERAARLDAYAQVRQAFDLPREKRLERIAGIAAERFGGRAETYLQRLLDTPAAFRQALLDEFEDAVYLLTALDVAVNGMPASPGLDPERAAREYARLLSEIHESARTQDIDILVVLVPEAGCVDADFREFWLPLADFRSYFQAQARTAALLAEQLPPEIRVLNLAKYPEALQGGYWKFDAHWNGRGNRAVADILAHEEGE